MRIDENNPKHLIADEGKELVRRIDNQHFGKEIYLGYSHYIGGKLVSPPHEDKAEDFYEVDLPVVDENVKFD